MAWAGALTPRSRKAARVTEPLWLLSSRASARASSRSPSVRGPEWPASAVAWLVGLGLIS